MTRGQMMESMLDDLQNTKDLEADDILSQVRYLDNLSDEEYQVAMSWVELMLSAL